MGMKNDDYLRALREMRPQHESTQPRHGRLKDSASRICRVHAEVKQNVPSVHSPACYRREPIRFKPFSGRQTSVEAGK